MRPTSFSQRTATLQRTSPTSKYGSAPPARLAAADTRRVTSDGDYRFEHAFPGTYGPTTLVDAAGEPKVFQQPFMKEVLELEAAKQNAAEESRRVALKDDGSQERVEQVTMHVEAERLVVRRRIALLNRLVTEHNTPLCYKAQSSPTHMATVVRYRLLQSDDHNGLFQTQAQQAWLLSNTFGWNSVLTSLQAGTHSPEPLIKLLMDIVTSSVKDNVASQGRTTLLKALHTNLQFTTEHHNMATAAHWGPPEVDQAPPKFVFTATTRDSTQVNICAASLDINYCDEWHNPCINKYVQVQVTRFGESVLQDIMQNGVPAHDLPQQNTATLRVTVIVVHQGMHHVFSLSPFSSQDNCVVTHIEVQDHADGILQLPDDPGAIVALPHATHTANTEIYSCAGSQRSTRLNEQELNYVHAQTLKGVHDMPHADLPSHHGLHHRGSDVPAKSARIAFTDWDVLVSSYRHAAGVATLITLFNYPPHVTRHYQSDYTTGYKSSHTRRPDTRPKRETSWTRPMPAGEMFYIPGMKDPNDVEMNRRQFNIHLVDHSQSRRQTMDFKQEAWRISRKIHEVYDAVWEGETVWPDGNYAKNIQYNKHLPDGVIMTMGIFYWSQWMIFIKGWVQAAMIHTSQGLWFEPPDGCYLYCKNPAVWHLILGDLSQPVIHAWFSFSQAQFHRDKSGLTLKEPPASRSAEAPVLGDKIALPSRARRTDTQTPQAGGVMSHAMRQMQEQIKTLELKLNETKLEENRECLMKKVLEKLSAKPTRP